jgi:hypothetical protein
MAFTAVAEVFTPDKLLGFSGLKRGWIAPLPLPTLPSHKSPQATLSPLAHQEIRMCCLCPAAASTLSIKSDGAGWALKGPSMENQGKLSSQFSPVPAALSQVARTGPRGA